MENSTNNQNNNNGQFTNGSTPQPPYQQNTYQYGQPGQNNGQYNGGQYNQNGMNNQYSNMGYTPRPQQPTNGAAVASLVCGILSIPTFCLYGLGLVLGILAVVFAIVSKKGQDNMSGMAIAGMITGIIGALITAVIWIIALLAVNSWNNSFSYWY